MIVVNRKEECCGCSACSQACPKQCITMRADECGFFYPEVDENNCIECHLCEKVCPVLNRFEPKEEPFCCYLGKTKDEAIRSQSSSGGFFTELAKTVLNEGGVVFGVRFDKRWQAVYDYTTTVDGLELFRGSKYIQTLPSDAFSQTRRYLKEGRTVLYTGTPCIIAGLKHFLQKDYENLLTMDIVCHSIPSPKVWEMYLQELRAKYDASIQRVSFRDKSNGWSHYSLNIRLKKRNGDSVTITETKDKNLYMQGFLNDLYTKPCCSECPARNFTSGSDITIADAWNMDRYHPELNDEKGHSHILLNSERGKKYFNKCVSGLSSLPIEYNEVEPFSMHLPITASCNPNPYRSQFYEKMSKGQSFMSVTKKLLRHYRYYQLAKRIKAAVRRRLHFK